MFEQLSSKIPPRVRRKIRYIVDSEFRAHRDELRRLRQLPRRTATTTDLLGATTHIVDAASFLSAYRAIFETGIYAFASEHDAPRIIDGGANIGLATLYWKRQFPDARITAFEPDAKIFGVLEKNLDEHGYDDVESIRKGLWSETTTLHFEPDGADGGHITSGATEGNGIQEVPVARLRPYLDDRIDVLKLDIEGAETEVLKDAAGDLQSVQHLFVEYHSYIGEEQRVDEILHVLRRAGFRIHVQPELVSSQPFIDRLKSNGMDHRLNIFGYRT